MQVPKQILILVTAILGTIMVADYFVAVPTINQVAEELQAWVLIIAGGALMLASLNLAKVQLRRVSDRRKDWQFSLVTVVALVAMAFAGLVLGRNSAAYLFLFRQVMAPIGSTLFACMIFFVTSASYRAFRVRNLQAGILLIAATFVLLGGAPAGEVIWHRLPAIRDWFLDIPTVAGNRAIIISAAVGTAAFGLKVLLGLERGQLGGGD